LTRQPDIIIFLSDQQRADTMGCYGQKLNVTPNLDKLAKEGTLFENAFSCQPVCGPARSCIQTGLYATETGCFKNNIALPQDVPTIAKELIKKGYQTAYVGKWHLASTEQDDSYWYSAIPKNKRGGYEYWMATDVLEYTSDGYAGGYVFDKDMNKVEFTGYRVDKISEFALDYLKKHRKDNKPYLLFVSWIEPHQQNNLDICQGPDYSKKTFKDFTAPLDLEKGVGNWEENYPDYLGACHSIDANIGKIVDYLKEEDKLNNTIILYTSDHACHFKTRNWEYKRTCHESSIKIPLIAYGKGFMGGNKSKQLCSLLDIAPTVLKVAGVDILSSMRGYILMDMIGNEDKREELFVQMSETQVGRAIRTKKWKYSVVAPDVNGNIFSYCDNYTENHLYDLENDPYEMNNLVSNENYYEIRKELREKLMEYILKIEGKQTKILFG